MPQKGKSPMSDPKHEWRGTIAVGTFEIGVRAYPAFGQATAPTLYQVHKDPCAPPGTRAKTAAKSGGGKRSKPSEGSATPRGRVLTQPVCMRCDKELKPDEIALQVTMPKGTEVQLEPSDLDAMNFERSERAAGRIALADDGMVNALGFDRRLYLLPEPTSIDDYWIFLRALQETDRIVFIPFIALKSDRAYVAVVRPIAMPSNLFDDASASREVLVLDCLGDTDKLKDPMDLPAYPGKPRIERSRLERVKAEFTRGLTHPIEAEECVNPRTAQLRRGVRRARRRILEASS